MIWKSPPSLFRRLGIVIEISVFLGFVRAMCFECQEFNGPLELIGGRFRV